MISAYMGHKNAGLPRGVDFLVALLGLTLLTPAILMIAILIRLGTPGPVFYTQQRLGRHGRLFWIYKFRKFYHCKTNKGYCVTLRNDPRMTPIGRILERTKLDELPQLWNILRGDMSLVGPRPETLEFSDCFTGRSRSVLEYRPGLFGPSQTIFRNESALYPADRDPHEFYCAVLFPAKADIDLAYFHTRTPFSDLLWIVRGIGATLGLPVSVHGVRLGRRLLESVSSRSNSIKREPLA